MNKIIVLLTFLVLPLSYVQGQDLSSIGKGKALKVNGGISLNQILYAVDGIERRRDPYSYYMSGQLAFSIYGWSIPFSFSLSNQNSSFQQPFNQYGLHPKYKWVTSHLGWSSMNFSPYTLNGHLFLGGGVELAPEGKWSVKAMYGRLVKAVDADSLQEGAYKRMGYGLQVKYGEGTDYVSTTIFRAADDPSSVDTISSDLKPQENLVLSIEGSKKIFEGLTLSGEFASSALSRDINTEESDAANNIFQYVGGLYTPRFSSSYYHAYKGSLSYQFSVYSLGVTYERIDPGYQTLGAYYFNNDMENITAQLNWSMFAGKLNMGVNSGLQRDNLDDNKVSAMRRWLGSLNVTYSPTQKLNITSSYSNFQTYTNVRSQFESLNQLTPYDNLDTLDFTQISQNASLAVVYMMSSSKEKRESVNVNFNFQDASDKQGGVEQNSGTQFYNMNLAYNIGLTAINTSFALSINASKNKSEMAESSMIGPSLAVNRTFFDRKVRASVSLGGVNSYSNSSLTNTVINLRANGSYTLKKKHNLTLNLVTLRRTVKDESTPDFTEFTGTLGYSFNF
ncbi:TonB-dependent receptor [Fulvivirga sediminis]|uniref:Uncharacterized protein n=1 Tax=Fulvivirga sediminis TaxID=2803949 RepID=A0A937K345_9BACT|nr:hypothetical protein [Fulvivirga sediminis]MBL3658572.1 hypothetical protein [Fulvivirga sediminis]